MYDRTCPKLLTNAASIYLYRWIVQWTTPHEHQMPCCNTFALRCHSQTYGCVAWHWTKLIKTWQIRVGLWMDEDEQQPVWATLSKASHACKELNRCSCKGLCVNDSCTCKKIQPSVYRSTAWKLDWFKFMSDEFCYTVNLQNITPWLFKIRDFLKLIFLKKNC